MFCFQCEQTAKGTGCTVAGVCGKDPRTAAAQDLLVHAAKGWPCTPCGRKLGVSDPAVNRFTLEALFTTVTNVNFDPLRMEARLAKAAAVRDRIRTLYAEATAGPEGRRFPRRTGGLAAGG